SRPFLAGRADKHPAGDRARWKTVSQPGVGADQPSDRKSKQGKTLQRRRRVVAGDERPTAKCRHLESGAAQELVDRRPGEEINVRRALVVGRRCLVPGPHITDVPGMERTYPEEISLRENLVDLEG